MSEEFPEAWPERPSWVFAASTLAIGLVSLLLVWLANDSARRARNATPDAFRADPGETVR